MTARTVIYTRSNPRTSAETSERQEGACRRLAEERRFAARATVAFAACESERAARIAEETVGDASAE
jgi:hypothetical protein